MSPGPPAALRSVDDLFVLVAAGADVDDGEDVDLLAHALQCADLLRDRVPDDPELHVAGLVHDVGTLLEPDRPATHAATGGAAVRDVLGPRVAGLVARHDRAKRYLVSVDDAYRARLSERSLVTLDAQGGLLDADARRAFEAGPDVDALLELRRADDAAKVRDRATSSLDAWRPVVVAVATRAGADPGSST